MSHFNCFSLMTITPFKVMVFLMNLSFRGIETMFFEIVVSEFWNMSQYWLQSMLSNGNMLCKRCSKLKGQKTRTFDLLLMHSTQRVWPVDVCHGWAWTPDSRTRAKELSQHRRPLGHRVECIESKLNLIVIWPPLRFFENFSLFARVLLVH